jgi:hypothetical protein
MRKSSSTLVGGLIYLALFASDVAQRTPQPTEAIAIAAEKILETERQAIFTMYLREAADRTAIDQVERAKREAEVQAMQQQAMENGRRGCLDDRTNAYLQLPLKVVDPVFRPCAVSLLDRTKIPLMLPPDVAKIHQSSSEPLTHYAYVDVTENGYSIGLTYDPRDHYQLNQALFSGEIITDNSPSLSAYYEESLSGIRSWKVSSGRVEAEMGAVTLANSVQGYYIPWVCGANCHSAYSSVIWDQNGYRYSISIKMGKKAAVLKIVNAAIKNQTN